MNPLKSNSPSPIITSPFSETERTGKGIFGDAYIYRLGDEEKNSGLLYSKDVFQDFTVDLLNIKNDNWKTTVDLLNIENDNRKTTVDLCNIKNDNWKTTVDLCNIKNDNEETTVDLWNIKQTIGANTFIN